MSTRTGSQKRIYNLVWHIICAFIHMSICNIHIVYLISLYVRMFTCIYEEAMHDFIVHYYYYYYHYIRSRTWVAVVKAMLAYSSFLHNKFGFTNVTQAYEEYNWFKKWKQYAKTHRRRVSIIYVCVSVCMWPRLRIRFSMTQTKPPYSHLYPPRETLRSYKLVVFFSSWSSWP
jgi:hypothetical protein